MNIFKSFLAEIAAALARREQTEAEFSRHFTPRAQEIFALAEDEAARLNHNFIGTEHVLLGLVRFGRGVAANVLGRQGVELEKVRAAVEALIGHAPDVRVARPIPFTPRVKRVLVIAHREARALNHTYVGSEHVLLGLLEESDGVAARVLKDFGLCAAQTRQDILKELDPNLHESDQTSQG